jgi:hypothetical protein
MLLRAEPDAVVAIGQASHAWLSGQLARAWRPRPEPWEAVCLAAEQHDVGMAQWDLAPSLNPATGLPHSFVQMPLEVHLRLWHAAPARLLTQSRYAALLTSLHGSTLYGMRDLDAMELAEADAVRGYLATQRLLQERLAAELGADAATLRAQQQLMFTWDGLSLALCLGWEPFEVGGVRLSHGTLEPWPFEGDELVVRCEGRRLRGRFADERELHAALERAPHVELAFTLRSSR